MNKLAKHMRRLDDVIKIYVKYMRWRVMDEASTSIKLIVWCVDNILMENNEIYSII